MQLKYGFDPRKFILAENRSAESIFEEILSHCKKTSLVIGVGNIAGPGMELIKFFSNRL
jgi:hypothetical protein